MFAAIQFTRLCDASQRPKAHLYIGHDVPVSRYRCPQPSTPVYKAANNVAFFFVEQKYDEKMPEILRRPGLSQYADDARFVTAAQSRTCMKEVVQTLEREFEKINLECGDELVVPAPPVQFSSFDTPERTLAPQLGADTAEILKVIGCSDEAIARMLEAGAAVQHD